MELTKEYFDKQIAKLATKDEIAKLATKEEISKLASKDQIAKLVTKEEIAKLATKEDLRLQSKELKLFAEEQTETLARIIAKTVSEPMELHFKEYEEKTDTGLRVKKLEGQMTELKSALHLS